MATTTVEIWVLLDSEGQYVARDDEDNLNEAYEENVQPMADAFGLRRVKLTVKVPLPAPIELEGEVADTEEAGTLTAKGA